MTSVLRFIWKRVFLGLVSLILILFLFLVGSWIWSALKIIEYQFVESPWLNGLIKIGLMLGFAFFLGLLVSWRWSRSLIMSILSKIPGVRTIAYAFFNHTFIERLKQGGLPEAMFEDVCGRWGFGIVTNEFKAPESPRDWKRYRKNPNAWTETLIDWCIVLGPPTAPLALTAQMWHIPKNRLVFVGFTAKDTTITVASFGFIFSLIRFIEEEKFLEGEK